jgi:hypothetical protein
VTAKQKKHPSRKSLAIIFIICAVTVDIAVFYTAPLRFLYPVTFNGGTGHLEIAAILFNDFNSTFTGTNNETKRRVHHGMSLLKNNKVEQLIVVGGNREKSKRKGAQLMADYMLDQGVPAEKIRIEANSKDSISNMEQLGKILAARNLDTLGLISSPYHLMRLQTMRIPFKANLKYYSYDPENSVPAPSRSEVWFSAHYNATAYAAQVILPESLYRKIVMWIREHTEW